jgi:hypothetical protein
MLSAFSGAAEQLTREGTNLERHQRDLSPLPFERAGHVTLVARYCRAAPPNARHFEILILGWAAPSKAATITYTLESTASGSLGR